MATMVISNKSKYSEANLIHWMKIFSRFVLFLCGSQKAIKYLGKILDLLQPLKIVVQKESQALTYKEIGKVKKKRSDLISYINPSLLRNQYDQVQHKFHFAMIDGQEF